MTLSKISINQLAEYNKKRTDKGKLNIIKQQKNPPPYLTPWYRIVKTRIRKSMELNGNLDPILDALKDLKSRPSGSKWQNNNNRGSINALEKYLALDFPAIFDHVDYSVFTPKVKSTILVGVEVLVSPEIVIKGKLNGKTVYGGVKIHVSSGKPFDRHQSQIVSYLIQRYLENQVADSKDQVLPELCICLDIFGERIVSSPGYNKELHEIIVNDCIDIRHRWDAA